MASVPCQSHTQKARSRPGSGTGTRCSVTSLSVPILCPASSLEKHCVSTLSFLGKLGTNFRTTRRVHGRPGQAGLDRLLRDARSVSRFGRCPCPRRLREGFGAPGLALKRCRPPWEVTLVGAPVSLRARRPHGDTPSCHVVGCVGVLCGSDSVSLRSRWDFPADIYPPPKPPAPRPQPGHSDHGGGKAAARWVGVLPGWVPSRSPLLVPGC